jgi:Ca2+-binding EF-hand superfamily protein
LSPAGSDAARARVSRAAAILRQYDADGTKSLGLEEFAALLGDLSSHSAASSSAGGDAADIGVAFTRFDADNSGSIDAKELKQALKHLGIEASNQQYGHLLRI